MLTTDELRGISDNKNEEVIEKIVMNDRISEDDFTRDSKMHFSRRQPLLGHRLVYMQVAQ